MGYSCFELKEPCNFYTSGDQNVLMVIKFRKQRDMPKSGYKYPNPDHHRHYLTKCQKIQKRHEAVRKLCTSEKEFCSSSSDPRVNRHKHKNPGICLSGNFMQYRFVFFSK